LKINGHIHRNTLLGYVFLGHVYEIHSRLKASPASSCLHLHRYFNNFFCAYNGTLEE